ncbi:MAG: hypothetical protein GY774_07170 [Planctomycetes bacterium]|nr:hypothetical protein [Planctomycetota bacterium]
MPKTKQFDIKMTNGHSLYLRNKERGRLERVTHICKSDQHEPGAMVREFITSGEDTLREPSSMRPGFQIAPLFVLVENKGLFPVAWRCDSEKEAEGTIRLYEKEAKHTVIDIIEATPVTDAEYLVVEDLDIGY